MQNCGYSTSTANEHKSFVKYSLFRFEIQRISVSYFYWLKFGICKSVFSSGRHFDMSVQYKWSEIKKHNQDNDAWIVIDNKIYDVTKWRHSHPGGYHLIHFYAGQDATEAFTCMHPNKKKPKILKQLKLLFIGTVEDTIEKSEMHKDFEKIGEIIEENHWYQPSVLFFFLQTCHIFLLELLSYWIFWNYGWNYWSAPFGIFTFLVALGQTGFLGHDIGHRCYPNLENFEYLIYFFAPFMWNIHSWGREHYKHHAKPNDIFKDPDRLEQDFMFFVGEMKPDKVTKPPVYLRYQHLMFIVIWIFPTTPVFFVYLTVKTLIETRFTPYNLMFLIPLSRFLLFNVNSIGWMNSFITLFAASALLNMWLFVAFTSVHLTMPATNDDGDRGPLHWVLLQMETTTNYINSPFIDWFTGGLSYQIEHHLFPAVPRQNFPKLQPYVQAFCAKHNIPYIRKSFLRSLADVFITLRKSAFTWEEFIKATKFE